MNKLLYLFILFICCHIGVNAFLVKTEVKPLLNKIKIDTSNINKRVFDKNFKSKYKSQDFVYEFKPKELNAWDRFKEWLSNVFKDIFNLNSNEASMNAVGIFLKTLAVILIIFVIYLITKAILNKEGTWIFGKNSDKKIVDYTDIEKNINQVDFEYLIKKTIQSGDNRLTIRYYYLWLLKNMAAKELIVWDIEKTNSDYIYEIKNQKTKENFEYASYLYNYIWYGEFELDQSTFDRTKTVFENILKWVENG